MMRVILAKELLDHLTSIRFHVCFLLLLTLMALNGFVYSKKYQKQQTEYHQMISEYETIRREAAGNLNEFTHQREHVAVKPPYKLAFLTSGGQGQRPNSIGFFIFSPHLDPLVMSRFNFSRNHLLRPFVDMDWAFLVGIGLSFVILVLVYDAVCGEKEHGTLGIALSNSVERWRILWGKFAAVMLTVSIAFVASVLVSLLILTLYDGLSLTSGDSWRLVVFGLLSLVYFALFAMAGILISALTTRAVTSLIIALVVWITMTFIPPMVGLSLVERLRPLPTPDQTRHDLKTVDDEIRREFKGKDSQWRGREVARLDNYADERVSNTAAQKRSRLYDEILAANIRRQLAQVEFVRAISMISPAGVFEAAAESLTGSGLLRDRRFLSEQRRYRETLAEFVQAADAKDSESPHLLFNGGWMSEKPVDPRSIPVFQFREASLSEGVKESLSYLGLLIVETLLVFTLGHVAFVRYDPR